MKQTTERLTMGERLTMRDAKEAVPMWFSRVAMEFFNSRIERSFLTQKGKTLFFVSSEKEEMGIPRRYTIRSWTKGEKLIRDTGFQRFPTLLSVRNAFNKLKEKGR